MGATNRQRTLAIGLVATAIAVLSACGSSDKPATAPATTPPGVASTAPGEPSDQAVSDIEQQLNQIEQTLNGIDTDLKGD